MIIFVYSPFFCKFVFLSLLKADLSKVISCGRDAPHFAIFIMARVYKDRES